MAEPETELLIRSAGCGELTEADAASEREVVLTGWVHRRRDLGQLIFVELRDATGRLQVVFDPSVHAEAHAAAEALRAEYVIGVRGVVIPREAPNPDHPTGMIELRAERVVIHNRADNLPIQVFRRARGQRGTTAQAPLHRSSASHGCNTRYARATGWRGRPERRSTGRPSSRSRHPILTRSTPEGARDYLVPSREHPGSFYALPQSPQLFKQLVDGGRFRTLLPVRALLQGRGPARRPATRVYADRHRDVVRDTRTSLRVDRTV